jgi:eukaryotic-like serine/threonine-protein kinase
VGAPATTEATRFGKYNLVARLATGGMAEIFLARLQGVAGFEKLVCIKRILPHLARDKQFVAMFLSEARIAARISHPNVCQVFELGEIEGSYYLAMEYLEGVPLGCFRRHDYYGVNPDPRLVAGIAVQACEGLHHAHQLKNADGSVMEVVHRDVSPQNLFVTVDGIVKVLDFGIAKIQGASVRTSTGAVKGTYPYMAPEQLRGERLDRRTDVFAMGIVMWETLTRRHLFRRETDFLTFQALMSDRIEDICALRPDVPPALSQVITTALSRDRDERFPTARLLGEAIAAAVPLLPPSAISEEIARAFPAQLAEQASLVRVARAGGAFDLDAERGPSVGHGTDPFATPISSLAGQLLVAPRAPTEAAPTIVSAPLQLPRRSWRVLVLAVLALAIGGAGAFLYTWATGEEARSDAVALGTPIAAGGAVSPAMSEDAAAAPPDDAGVVAVTDPAAPAEPAPVEPAPREAPAAKRPAPSVSRPAAPRRTGPPGFVTIDSTPYAVIAIDGKSYGDTPLVKLELAPGRHTVRAKLPSGATREVRIQIESGKEAPTVRFAWKPADHETSPP